MPTFSGGQPPGTPGAGPPSNQTISSPTRKDGLTSPTISDLTMRPGLKTMAEAVKNSSGGPTNMRSFAQILEQEKKDRNILELRITKIRTEEALPPNYNYNSNNMSAEDIGELLFDILKLNPSHCLAYDYNTGRNDTKQVKLKPGIPVTDILAQSPLVFKDFNVVVSQQRLNITRVTFKNVPLNVPDEEIIHLCLAYGRPLENKVQYEVLRNSRNKGHTGSTRFVDMELFEGSSFNNYYWMEGPFPGDQGRRVLVLHSGQAQQCSNCLKIGPNCPAAGNGKLCKDEMNTPRAKMSVYMNSLKISKNYTSLKNQYLEAQCKKFPLVSGDIVPPSSASDMDNLDTVQSDILPSNPRAELDSKIKALQESLTKAQESAQNKDEQIAQLEEQLKEAPKSFNEAEVKKLKRDLSTARRKVDKIYDGSANRLLCAITNVETPLNVHDEGFKSACSLFANSSFDPSLTEEEIDKMNSEDGYPDVDKDVFKPIRDNVNFSDAEQSERFGRTRNKVVELLKVTANSRRNSLCRSPSSKRGIGEKEDNLQPAKMVNDRSSPSKDTVPRSRLPSLNAKK